MARSSKKESVLTLEEKLAQSLIPVWEQPYKVPKNWCWVKFGAVCKFENGFSFKSEKFTDNSGIPVVRISNIKDDMVSLDDCVRTTEEGIDDKFIIHQGDLLIAMSGATTGKNGVYYSSEIAYLNQRVGNIKVKSIHVLLPSCRNYYIKATSDEILRNAYGGAQPNISSNKICEMAFPLAPIAEQQRIVNLIENLFDKLDEARGKVQAMLDSFETRKAAILHEAFTGELTAKWRAEHGVGKDSWLEGCLSDFCEVNPKKAVTKNLSDDLDVSFVPMPALSDVLGEIIDPQVRKLKDVRNGFTNFSEGDVVFAKITPCMENGKSAVVGPLVNDMGFGTTELYVLRCTKMLFNRYLYHLVRSQSFRAEAKAVMTGAVGQQRVPKSFLESYPIALPSVPEQTEIVRILDSLFTKEQQAKEAAEAVLEQINLLKKSILARAFRGELGTNDPSEESAVELLKRVLESDAPAETKKRSKSVPKELREKLETELERKIIHLYFQRETESLPAEVLLSASSKKFDVLEALHNLEQRELIKKLNNGNYRLLG